MASHLFRTTRYLEKERLKELDGVRPNYLRYYCDQNYAKELERIISVDEATLYVRIWRGRALAEALYVNGNPAYEYVDKMKTDKKIIVRNGSSTACICDVLNIDGEGNCLPSQGRLVVRGVCLVWDVNNENEGSFLQNKKSSQIIPCELLETYKKDTCFLIRLKGELNHNDNYDLYFISYLNGKKIRSLHRVSFR